MSLVTVSTGSLHTGRKVAKTVAESLGYRILDRQFLIEASEQFNVPEVKLIRAMDEPPKFLDHLTFGKDKYVTYIRNALLEQMADDDVVYQGIAGQFFLQDVSHVVKVRIINKMENRVKDVMEHDNATEKEAVQAIKRIDEARKKWSLHFYGIDIEDPGLYDLTINVSNLSVEEAAELIVTTALLPRFQTTPESKKHFQDLMLASRVKAAVVKSYPKASISSKDGVVLVSTEGVLT